MTGRPRLGLDLGGVLLARLMPGLAHRLAAASGRPPAEVEALLGDRFRMPYWAGRLPEAALWSRLGLDPPPGDRRALVGLRVLPAMRRVPAWSRWADVWVVSNHRHEWVEPVLREAGLDRVAARVLVSSRTGRVKPDPAALAPLLGPPRPPRVLFVDDQERNLATAAALGLETLLADPGGRWADAVDRWLGQAAP